MQNLTICRKASIAFAVMRCALKLSDDFPQPPPGCWGGLFPADAGEPSPCHAMEPNCYLLAYQNRLPICCRGLPACGGTHTSLLKTLWRRNLNNMPTNSNPRHVRSEYYP